MGRPIRKFRENGQHLRYLSSCAFFEIYAVVKDREPRSGANFEMGPWSDTFTSLGRGRGLWARSLTSPRRGELQREFEILVPLLSSTTLQRLGPIDHVSREKSLGNYSRRAH